MSGPQILLTRTERAIRSVKMGRSCAFGPELSLGVLVAASLVLIPRRALQALLFPSWDGVAIPLFISCEAFAEPNGINLQSFLDLKQDTKTLHHITCSTHGVAFYRIFDSSLPIGPVYEYALYNRYTVYGQHLMGWQLGDTKRKVG
jgi:hypothetical protein